MANFFALLGGVIEEYLPRLLGGLGVLVAGWLIAMLAAHIIRRMLHRSLLDDRLAEAIIRTQRVHGCSQSDASHVFCAA